MSHYIRIVDHGDEVDEGDGRVQHVGPEEVFVKGDPLAAQAPAVQNRMRNTIEQTLKRITSLTQ